MTDRIVHRGPDAGGAWVDPNGAIALGHRRLSILDLSPEGAQPMISRDGRYVISFNGEIYNFKSIRDELIDLGHNFRGHSDTEVMLVSFCQWGVECSVPRFSGMFAFAVWDREERNLYLFRDRIGEKPLYYGWLGGLLLFGSEMKALRAHPEWRSEVDRDALALLLQNSYIPAPYSIHKGFHKLLPGTYLKIPGSGPGATELVPKPYWSFKSTIENSLQNPFLGDDLEAVKIFETRLMNVIGNQMVSDVPLGAFLSGGVDSSAVVALMQAQSSKPIKSFTIGFQEKSYDESIYAKAVARHLGTEHTELYASPKQALEIIPRLPEIYDEPFADVSQIPTTMVSMMTRKYVTVCLSGDGGDELLAGYNRYFLGRKLWGGLRFVPWTLRKSCSELLDRIPPAWLGGGLEKISPYLPAALRQNHFGDKVLKFTDFLSAKKADDLYFSLVSFWKNPCQVALGSKASATILSRPEDWPKLRDFTERMMYLDSMGYLPGDIMVKVDRASMSASLESRAPFLDHKLVEFVWTLPMSMKIRNRHGKWLLRQVLYKHVPRELIERPKMGFGVPLEAWLRGPLRDWAESLLQESKLREQGFLDSNLVRKIWEEHQSGQRNWHYQLWIVLMFQAWLEHQQKAV